MKGNVSNALAYGASGGKIFVAGISGNRTAILMKGAVVVVEGVGDMVCEYMTSGTFMNLGPFGEYMGTGACGGIII